MIKDKVIRPLLIATEKVVEYYFPEEADKMEAGQSMAAMCKSKLRSFAGGKTRTTKTTTMGEETLSEET